MKIAWYDGGRHRRNSGYGHASRVFLAAMNALDGVEIVLIGPLPGWEDDTARDPALEALPVVALNTITDCDFAIQVCTPESAKSLPIPSALYTFLDVSGPTLIQERIMRSMALVIAPNTQNQQAYAQKDIPHCLFQPNINLSLFKPQPRWRIEGERGLSFIFVGTHSYRKGTDLLIDSFCEVFKRQNAHLHMHIPGTNPDALHNHIIRQSLHHRRAYNITISSNYMSSPWLARFYARADCYITCTRGEGWGIPAMEAMGVGLPVVGPLCGGMRDFMDPQSAFAVDGEMRPVNSIDTVFGDHFSKKYSDANALEYFEPSQKSILAQMKAVARYNRDDLRERGEQGRRHLLGDFSPTRAEDQAATVLAKIEELLSQG